MIGNRVVQTADSCHAELGILPPVPRAARRPVDARRHGYTSATRPGPGRPKNTYVREDQLLPHLPPWPSCWLATTRPGASVPPRSVAAQTAGLIDQLRASGAILTYDPDTRTIRADGSNPVAIPSRRRGCQDLAGDPDSG